MLLVLNKPQLLDFPPALESSPVSLAEPLPLPSTTLPKEGQPFLASLNPVFCHPLQPMPDLLGTWPEVLQSPTSSQLQFSPRVRLPQPLLSVHLNIIVEPPSSLHQANHLSTGKAMEPLPAPTLNLDQRCLVRTTLPGVDHPAASRDQQRRHCYPRLTPTGK